MVLRLEEAEPAAAVRQVVDVVRERLHEPVHLVDQLRHERRADADDDHEQQQVGDPDRRAARQLAAPFDPADQRIEGEREEQGDDDPGEDVPGDPDDLERDRNSEDDQQDPQDRARAKIDDPLGRHSWRIPRPSDVVTVAP